MPTTGEPPPPPESTLQRPDLGTAAATVAAVAAAVADERAAAPHASVSDLLDALALLRFMRDELAAVEPALIAAARHAGASWQTLAPALGVASRQAAERRYLRLVPAQPDQASDTRDSRVRAERDRRAGHRAVARWANDNTADLRRLAGQITALADLDDDSAAHIDRLHHALADADATALPLLLAATQRYLHRHPELADQIDSVAAHTERVRRQTQERRDDQGG